MSRGLLISFDGIDSSGKATQVKQLAQRLRYIGWVVHELQSPDYTTPTGRELKERLQGKKGDWAAFPWERKLHLFATNRAEKKAQIREALKRGEIILYDRYVASSQAFIAVEALEPQDAELYREEVYAAVEKLEYLTNGMPHEDVSIFLDVPPRVAEGLLVKRKKIRKEADEYTDHISVMERLYNEYDFMTNEDPKRFLRIRCVEGEELLGVEDTAALVWEGLLVMFPFLEKKS